jgi:hypothetical protein
MGNRSADHGSSITTTPPRLMFIHIAEIVVFMSIQSHVGALSFDAMKL